MSDTEGNHFIKKSGSAKTLAENEDGAAKQKKSDGAAIQVNADELAKQEPVGGSFKRIKSSIRVWVVSTFIYLVFSLLKWTWRIEEDSFPDEIREREALQKPVIVAHFHEDEWALLGAWANRGAHTLVSLSSDGGVMTRFLSLFGWSVARGSSSRGGAVGLLSLIRNVKRIQTKSKMITIAVDGPKGPRRRAKKGVFKLAQSLDAPVMIMAAAASKRFVFGKSWSKAFIPLPFAKVKVTYPNFLTLEEITKALSRDDDAEVTYKLEESLKSAKAMAKQKLI